MARTASTKTPGEKTPGEKKGAKSLSKKLGVRVNIPALKRALQREGLRVRSDALVALAAGMDYHQSLLLDLCADVRDQVCKARSDKSKSGKTYDPTSIRITPGHVSVALHSTPGVSRVYKNVVVAGAPPRRRIIFGHLKPLPGSA
jgi:hypothetical protein